MTLPTPPLRKKVPFGFPRTPFDPGSGEFLPLADRRLIRAFTLVEELYDCLRCADEHGHAVFVEKPYILRKTPFDGETVNDVTYTYTTASLRTATDGTTEEDQAITPDYYVGEIILAVHRRGVYDDPEDAASVDGMVVCWTDLNTAGRCWAVVQE